MELTQRTALEPLMKMSKDIKEASQHLGHAEARYLVDAYYMMQDQRIRSANQIRSMEGEEPNEVLQWFSGQSTMLENQIKNALGRYASAQPIGKWLQAQKGIGPVISAGLIAHIDINKAQTAGAIWKYAGLDPSVEWKKGEKRPWNATLKTLCAYKIGESFVKVSNKEDAFYGQLYKQRKEQEIAKNEAGGFAEQAKQALEKKKYSKSTDAYKAYIEGKLPKAHIHRRAVRYTVKIFLSHLHQVWREAEGLPVPKPFAISILGHAHEIVPPKM